MSKHKKDPLIEALEKGCSFTWTVPDGGNMASMRAAIKHGQTLTMAPIHDPGEIQVGDMVLVKWHGGTILHLVGDVRDGRFLITNSLGKENGWVGAGEILGRVVHVIEPEPRPAVPEMLDILESTCQGLIDRENPTDEDARRLLSIVGDLRWYAGRVGAERWDVMPRANKWSFAQNLWQITKQTREGAAPVPDRVRFFTDLGKQCIGLAGEICALFEYGEPE